MRVVAVALLFAVIGCTGLAAEPDTDQGDDSDQDGQRETDDGYLDEIDGCRCAQIEKAVQNCGEYQELQKEHGDPAGPAGLVRFLHHVARGGKASDRVFRSHVTSSSLRLLAGHSPSVSLLR